MHNTITKNCWLIATLFMAVFATSAMYANPLPAEAEDTGGYCYGSYRSKVYVKNKSNCTTKVYCHEISADGKTYYMGALKPWQSFTVRPSAKKARIYAKTNGIEVASVNTTGCNQYKQLYINSCGSQCRGEIDEIVLYNTHNSHVVATLEDGGVYYLDELPSNFGVETVIDGDVESVSFTVNGHSITENIVPYTYPAGGAAWHVSEGHYTIKTAAYSDNYKGGKKCDEKHISIEFKKKREDECKGKISDFILYNTHTHATITTLEDGGMYFLGNLPANFGIEAVIHGEVGSVFFNVNGDKITENVEPFTYPGGGQTWNPAPGTYEIKGIAYSKNNKGGKKCDTDVITIHIKDECDAAITGLKFNSLSGGSDVALSDGDYNLSDLPASFNIEAMTSGDVGSVRFMLSGDDNATHTENFDPYRFIGDDNPYDLGVGHYTLKVEVFSESHAQGEVCDMVEVSFNINDDCEDADEDGTCDEDDCAPNDPAFPADPGTPCDDGDDETLDDVIGDDGCSCAGVCPELTTEQETTISFCKEDSYTFIITTNAPESIYDLVEVVIYDSPQVDPYNPVGNPFVRFLGATPIGDGNVSITPAQGQLNGLSGTYYGYACYKPAPSTCPEFIEYVITIEEDSDRDGVCDINDCAPNDSAFPADPGTPCDDGNIETLDDAVGDDGCSCEGVCPPITSTVPSNISFCREDSYTFDISTTAPESIYDLIEIVAYDAPQVDPYNPVGNPFVRFLGATSIGDGNVVITPELGQLSGLSGTYYLYVCYKPEPTTCLEFVEIIADIQRCTSPFLSNPTNGADGVANATINTNAVGINSTNGSRADEVNASSDVLSNGLKIYQNKPNPFRNATDIAFELPQAGKVSLLLTDVTGKTTTVVDADFNSGYNRIRLDRNDLASGIYYYTLQTEVGQVTKKLVILD